MTTTTPNAADKNVDISLDIVRELFARYPAQNVSVRLWDGTMWNSGLQSHCTIVLKHPGALRNMFLSPTELTMSTAYVYDDFDIEGNIDAIFPLAEYIKEIRPSLAERLHLARRLHQLPSRHQERSGRLAAVLHGASHSRERDRRAVTYHYDTSNEFFGLFLDVQMVYSCAYFETPDDDLDAAQQRKLEYICRKLRLQRGERLLDIGCGWGGLTIYAAQNYGVSVLGITLSEPQAELARRRIGQAGLSATCRVEVCDYRELDAQAGFEKLVSVGMFEHVGEELLPEYFGRAYRLLRPGGVFLNHGIARRGDAAAPAEPTFSDRYVFPDGEPVPLHGTLRAAEVSGFEVRDVESLREHYAYTLHHWARRLEARHREAVEATDESTYRVWRLFMSGSAHRFEQGELNVYQTLLAKTEKGRSGLPLTRKDWYA